MVTKKTFIELPKMTSSENPFDIVVLNPVISNNAPPILLVHGAWHAAWCWKPLAQELARKGYEVHYFSLPGHGRASLNKAHLNQYSLNDYVQYLSDRIDEIDPKPVVIGHSMGGALLQIYLQKNTLPAAVLMASIPKQGTLPLIARIAMQFPITLLKAILSYKSEVIVDSPERARALFFSPDNPIDYKTAQKRLGPESMKILFPLMYCGTFKKIRPETPVYVLAGEKDKITSVCEQKRLARFLSADFTVVEGQAHCMMLEPKYKDVVQRIDNWIQNHIL
jgi:pimeloyl-ACP methyl ester carboxylesterase